MSGDQLLFKPATQQLIQLVQPGTAIDRNPQDPAGKRFQTGMFDQGQRDQFSPQLNQ